VRVISRNARFVAVAVLLVTTSLLLRALTREQFTPARSALASFPLELKSWTGVDVPIPDETLQGLGAGEFLQRTYENPTAADAGVDLYLAYLPNRPALYHHLPQDCLIGSGWSPVQGGTTTLAFPGDAPFTANRYLIARGDERQVVLFWYAAHGRRMASENKMDFYLVLDSLRLNRSDNALVRMNTEIRPGEKAEEAQARLLAFAGLVNPLLNTYIPR
jgi:EpsI family protein